jgi:hypothetical protein
MERGTSTDTQASGQDRTTGDGALAAPATRGLRDGQDSERRATDPESNIIRGED